MKTLIIYPLVRDKWVQRFLQAQEWQAKFEGTDQYERVIVTDQETEIPLPFPILRYDDLWEDGLFNISRAFNRGYDYALGLGADWLVHGFSDYVYLNWMTESPSTGFGYATGFYADPLQSDIDWDHLQWQGFPSFVVARRWFESIRICEEFTGYAFDDFDFPQNVMWMEHGIETSPCDLKCIHFHHESSHDTWSSQAQFARNQELYLSRAVHLAQQTGRSLHVFPDSYRKMIEARLS